MSKWTIQSADLKWEPTEHDLDCLARIEAAVMRESTPQDRRLELLRLTQVGFNGLGFHTFAMRSEWWQIIWDEAAHKAGPIRKALDDALAAAEAT